MIFKKDIPLFRSQFGVGQKIKCSRYLSGDRVEEVTAEIIGIYPHFAEVSDGKMRWCVLWKDLMRMGKHAEG